jgi:Raf kinase inhibitor-like YbhB/YbcL family protein
MAKRNRSLKLEKRKLAKPSLAESKFAILVSAAILGLSLGFAYAWLRSQYPRDVIGAADLDQNPQIGGREGNGGALQISTLKFTSPAFGDGNLIPTKYTCAAGATTVSPPLQWGNIPEGTASFALVVHDLESNPRRGAEDSLQWMIWNIPPFSTELPEGVPSAAAELPDGSRQSNGGLGADGRPGYRGPCAPPPHTRHHCVYELFALDQKLDLDSGTTRTNFRRAIDGHIVGHAVLIGFFDQ